MKRRNFVTSLEDGNGESIDAPDLADLIYHVFRCKNAHGEEVPEPFSLIRSEDGLSDWKLAKDEIRMPDRIIWALLAVAVFCKANADVRTSEDHFLSWGSERLGLGTHKFTTREWWGREEEFREFILPRNNMPRVKMENLEELWKNG